MQLRLPAQLSQLARWLPTVYFFGAILGLLALALVVRSIVMIVSDGGSPAGVPADLQQAVAVVEQPVAVQPAPPAAQVRFEVRQLQPTYTVVAGDSLSAIAQRVGATTQALKGINNISDDAFLRVGQRLIIP